MKRTNEIISTILLVCMMVTLIPLQAFAEETFTVDYNLTNVTVNGEISTVTSGTAISVSITADEGYELPDTITVNGIYDDYSYDKLTHINETAYIEIINVQSNIEIVVEGNEPSEAPVKSHIVIMMFTDEEGNELLAPQTLTYDEWIEREYDYLDTISSYNPIFEKYNFTSLKFDTEFTESGEIVTAIYTGSLKTGVIFISYVDENGNLILPVETHINPVGEYTFNALEIEGYTVIENSRTVTISEHLEVINITFHYIKEEEGTGTVIVRYEDENGNELLPEDTYLDLELGEHTFYAPMIEGYIVNIDILSTILEYDSQIGYVVFTYTEIEKETNYTVNWMYEKEFNTGEYESLDSVTGQGELSDEDIENYIELGNTFGYEYVTNDVTEFTYTLADKYNNPEKVVTEVTVNVFYDKEQVDFEDAQLKVVLADCSDIQNLDEAIDIFMERSFTDSHNVMDELYFDLKVGENIINIPSNYKELEWQYTGSMWDSEFTKEIIEDEQGIKSGITLTEPYLIDLTLYVGYISPEVEEPEPSNPIYSGGGGKSTPKAEEQHIDIKEISQTNFVARYLNHKVISKEFKKFTKSNVEFEVDKTLMDELLAEGLTPRIYRWNETKGKLIAEATEFKIKQGTDNLYTLTIERTVKDNYYTLIAVKQPEFKDVKEFDYHLDKANGLGLIEGIEKDGIRYFEADKTISKSEFYTMIARIFGAMPDGETKMYDILDLKTIEESEKALEEIEIGIDDWAKPYVFSLLDKGYIVTSDLKNNKFNPSTDFKLVQRLLEEVENNKCGVILPEGDTREEVAKALTKLLGEYEW